MTSQSATITYGMENWRIKIGIIVSLMFMSWFASAAVYHRNDVVRTLRVTNGTPWGTWQRAVFCNPGTWVRGFKLRVEQPIGDGDDTALNNIKLYCADYDGDVIDYAVSDGSPNFGTWGTSVRCGYDESIIGYRLKVERPIGNGDDTAVNDLKVLCSDGSELVADNGAPWGTWGQGQKCPSDSAVCGMSLRIEPSIGNGDDTSVNDVSLYCCRK